MAFKFVDELPPGYKKPNTTSPFNDELAAALQEKPGQWALVEGGTGQGAAAFLTRMKERGLTFKYESVDTGKPTGEKRQVPNGKKGETYEVTKKEIYVRYTEKKEDESADD